MILKKAQFNYELLQERIFTARRELEKSHLSCEEKKIVKYVYSQILDGVDHKKFYAYNNEKGLYFFSLSHCLKGVFIKMIFKNGETIKAFPDVDSFNNLLLDIEFFFERIGLSFRLNKSKKDENIDFFLKN